MKIILVLLVLLAVGMVALYYGSGVDTLDPTGEGKQAFAAVNNGMTWKKVIETTTEPGKYSWYILRRKKIGGVESEMLEPAVETKFKRALFEDRFLDGEFPHGFLFFYRYSPASAFTVEFDAEGKVSGKSKDRTTADLYQLHDD